ncbi:MAG: hypothetical protein AAB296_09280 [Candidatus Desantisbacteria bacterium]
MGIKKNGAMLISFFASFILFSFKASAQETTGLSLNERITRMETKVDEGFKSVDQRFDSVEQRFDDMNTRIDDLKDLIYVVLAGMIALIGFVIWDRRTTLAPVAHELKEVVRQEELILDALKRYAQQEPKLAQAIKSAGLL